MPIRTACASTRSGTRSRRSRRWGSWSCRARTRRTRGSTPRPSRGRATARAARRRLLDALVMLVRLHDPHNWASCASAASSRPRGPCAPCTSTARRLAPARPRARASRRSAACRWCRARVQARRLGHGRANRASPSDATRPSASRICSSRDGGALSFEEAGFDFASSPVALVRPRHPRRLRPRSTRASPRRAPRSPDASAICARRSTRCIARRRDLLPATSLFSALGDTPADTVAGGAVRWRMFPRLDCSPWSPRGTRRGIVGVDGTLRVDAASRRPRGRRDVARGAQAGLGAGCAGPGAHGRAGAPRAPVLRDRPSSSSSRRTTPNGRGAVWPWGLVALRWTPIDHWEVAGAVEAASTPTPPARSTRSRASAGPGGRDEAARPLAHRAPRLRDPARGLRAGARHPARRRASPSLTTGTPPRAASAACSATRGSRAPPTRTRSTCPTPPSA